jgi:aminoglycoside phosphotransferase (APT) family kinase protein
MQFRPVERVAQAFQRSLTAVEIQQICARAFGKDACVESAVELGLGMYNSTYRVTMAGQARPVILRVAPEPDRQFRSELGLMRTEHATLPWLAAIAPLLPRVIAADWSHDVVGRDWMIQTLLDGIPAPDERGLRAYPRATWTGFYRQLGAIAKTVHAVRGQHFGTITGPGLATWGQALVAALDDIVVDLDGLGLDTTDLREVVTLAGARHAVLDEVVEPRLLVGDLWTVNVMLAEGADAPTISGVLDLDRGMWGDPAADWSIRMALEKPGTERDAFWDADGYGALDSSSGAVWRQQVYEARHIGAARLECHRLADTDGVRRTYDQLDGVLRALRAG